VLSAIIAQLSALSHVLSAISGPFPALSRGSWARNSVTHKTNYPHAQLTLSFVPGKARISASPTYKRTPRARPGRVLPSGYWILDTQYPRTPLGWSRSINRRVPYREDTGRGYWRTKTIVGVADAGGELIAHARVETPNALGPEANLQAIVAAARECVREAAGRSMRSASAAAGRSTERPACFTRPRTCRVGRAFA